MSFTGLKEYCVLLAHRWSAGQQCQWTRYGPCETAVKANLSKHACFSFSICRFNPSHIAHAAGSEGGTSEAVCSLASVLLLWSSVRVLRALFAAAFKIPAL